VSEQIYTGGYTVSVKIRLKRFGAKKRPYYRLVVIDSRSARNGAAIEEVGIYHPVEAADKQLIIKEDRIREWYKNGAQPSDSVRQILNNHKFYFG
jgi:small subunit ribosomal protein S16